MEIEFKTDSDIYYSNNYFSPGQNSPTDLHEAILCRPASNQSPISLDRISLSTVHSATDKKTRETFSRSSSTHLMKRAGNGSADVNVTVSWGGKDGVTISGGASGEVYDTHGNYAKAEVKHDSNGEGNATISAGHKDHRK